MLANARGSRFYVPLVLAVTTGMRREEILALRWEDVDLEKKTLRVRRSLEQTREGLAFKAPKTNRGNRVIALPGETVEALAAEKKRQAEQRLALGAAYENHDLVVCRATGEPLSPSAFSGEVRAHLRGIGVSVRFHDLRHTHATMLLRQGINPKVVSERLGHATVGMTLDVYSHVLADMQASAAESVDAALATARTVRTARP